MIKSADNNYYIQAIHFLIMLNAFVLGYVIAWITFNQASKPKRGPGINFKEF